MPGVFGGGGGGGGGANITPALARGVYVPQGLGTADRTFLGQLYSMLAGTDQAAALRPQAVGWGQQVASQVPNLIGESQNLAGQVPGLFREAQGLWGLEPGLTSQAKALWGQEPALFGQLPALRGLAAQELNAPTASPVYRNLENTIQQGTAAANAASGVRGPYASGLTAEALNNLSLGWQQQAPQIAEGLINTERGILGTGAGLAGAGAGLLDERARLAAAGGGLLGQGADLYRTGAGLTSTAGALAPTAENVLASSYQLPETIMSEVANYLGLGQGAQQLRGQLGQLAFNQNRQQLGDIGGLLGSLGGGYGLGSLLFGPGNSPFGSGGLFGLFGLGGGGGGGGGGDYP